MSDIVLKARVQVVLDETTYEAGEGITLPEQQRARAQELVRHGVADFAEKPPAPRRRKAAS